MTTSLRTATKSKPAPSARPDADFDYALGRARNVVFDSVLSLFEHRVLDWDLTLTELADRLGRDKAWVSRTLSGPGNWTLKTWSDLVEAMAGEIVVEARPREHIPTGNYDIYNEAFGMTISHLPSTVRSNPAAMVMFRGEGVLSLPISHGPNVILEKAK